MNFLFILENNYVFAITMNMDRELTKLRNKSKTIIHIPTSFSCCS